MRLAKPAIIDKLPTNSIMIIMNLDLNQTMKKKRNIFLKTQNHHFKIKENSIIYTKPDFGLGKKRIHSDFLLLQLVYMLYC